MGRRFNASLSTAALLQFLAFFLFQLVSAQTCFSPNGTAIDSDILLPCQINGQFKTCCKLGDWCLANGLCQDPLTTDFYRGGCTVAAWDTAFCADICTARARSVPSVFLLPCPDVANEYFCSYDADRESCENHVDTFGLIGAVQMDTAIAYTVPTQLASSPPIPVSQAFAPPGPPVSFSILTTFVTCSDDSCPHQSSLPANLFPTASVLPVSGLPGDTLPVPAPPEKKPVSPGIIVGPIIGGIAAIILALLALFIMRRRRSQVRLKLKKTSHVPSWASWPNKPGFGLKIGPGGRIIRKPVPPSQTTSAMGFAPTPTPRDESRAGHIEEATVEENVGIADEHKATCAQMDGPPHAHKAPAGAHEETVRYELPG